MQQAFHRCRRIAWRPCLSDMKTETANNHPPHPTYNHPADSGDRRGVRHAQVAAGSDRTGIPGMRRRRRQQGSYQRIPESEDDRRRTLSNHETPGVPDIRRQWRRMEEDVVE